MNPLLLPATAGACVLVAGLGVRLLAVAGFDAPVRVRPAAPKRVGSITDRLAEWIGRPVAPSLTRLLPDRSYARLESRLQAAGGLGGTGAGEFMARRAGGVTVGLVVGGLWVATGSTVVAALFAAVIGLRADVLLHLAAKRRQEEIGRMLPDLLDVLSVTITAGASFRLGLARVAEAFDGALSDELLTTLRRMELGVDRRTAFTELRDRNPAPSLRKFVAAVLQAEELGSSLSGALGALATEVRAAAGHQARRRADSVDKSVALITTLILLPGMVLLVLTAFFGGIDFGG